MPFVLFFTLAKRSLGVKWATTITASTDLPPLGTIPRWLGAVMEEHSNVNQPHESAVRVRTVTRLPASYARIETLPASRLDPLAAVICSQLALSCRCRPTRQNTMRSESAQATNKAWLVNKWCSNWQFAMCKQIGHVTPTVDIVRLLLPLLIKIWGCRSIFLLPTFWLCQRTLYSLYGLGKGFSDAIETR